MPFANNHGVRIHYETEGRGAPVVLQYGQYFPLEIWYELNYVRVMQDDCRLILVDARGHGDNDKPHDPAAYRIELMASDIVSVLDELGLETAHYMGYSSGGFLGFCLAKLAPGRFSSLILGGTYPYADPDPEAGAAWHVEQASKLGQISTADFVAGLEAFIISQGFPLLSARMRAAMLKHDPPNPNLRTGTFVVLEGCIAHCLLFEGYRDDCCFAAWGAHRVQGHAWEALDCLAQNDALTFEGLHEKPSRRGVTREVHAPWACLSESSLEELSSLARQLRDGLKRPFKNGE